MIEGFTGLLGGGKTYSAVKRIAEYLASGGMVFTNIHLELEAWFDGRYKVKRPGLRWALKQHYAWDLQPGQLNILENEQLARFFQFVPRGTPEKPVLVVIDEAAEVFDALDARELDVELRSFLRQSRKVCVDVVMIVQDWSMLQKRIRVLSQFVWVFLDMKTFRLPAPLYCRMPWPWSECIVQVQMEKTMKHQVRRVWVAREAWVFGSYRTDELYRDLKVLSDGRQTNFQGQGRQGGKKMNGFQKFALAASWVIALGAAVLAFSARREAQAATAAAKKAAVGPAAGIAGKGRAGVRDNGGGVRQTDDVQAESVPAAPTDRIAVVEFQNVRRDPRRGVVVYINGAEYWQGRATPDGVVVGASDECVIIRPYEGGKLTLIDGPTNTLVAALGAVEPGRAAAAPAQPVALLSFGNKAKP